jgi:phage tail-like protein
VTSPPDEPLPDGTPPESPTPPDAPAADTPRAVTGSTDAPAADTSTSGAPSADATPFYLTTYNATTLAGTVKSDRRMIPGLRTPFPMINYTSSMLIEDVVAQKICASLDEVLAPIISVLDCYDSYLDAQIAPLDFVRYMCTWILVNPELGWNESIIRNALAHAITFYGKRGTAAGVEGFFSTVFGLTATVEESGSVTTSRDFTDPSTWPAAPLPSVTITVEGLAGRDIDINFAKLVLDTAVPAHVDAKLVEAP